MKARATTAGKSKILPRPYVAKTTLARRGKPKASDKKNRSRSWLDAVRSIPQCVLCRKFVQVEAAHMNEGKGMSRKVPDCFTAALCPDCHHAIDNGNEMTLAQRRDLMRLAVKRTLLYLFTNKLIGAI